jgi:benzoyl-CoA reductase/2-hydroxyglutaryl-CoA dehydratase subunit BcrC/BadD/HgdB
MVGYTCCYTPLALITAAGFTPYRVLPLSSAPDQAGSLLHDNLCPQVKRILDRGLAGDLPELQGMVIMTSCDAMCRLADAWQRVCPDMRLLVVDLPPDTSERSVSYFAGALEHLLDELAGWADRAITAQDILAGNESCNRLAEGLARLAGHAAAGGLGGGWQTLQEIRNRSVTRPWQETADEIDHLLAETRGAAGPGGKVPLLIYGNVLPDPEAFALLAECGVEPVADDLCTGARQLLPVSLQAKASSSVRDLMEQLAGQLLSRPPCARTLCHDGLGQEVVSRAQASGAQGVIMHLVKFCDPYLARLPAIRRSLREAGLPVLVLEGDCSLRSLGQHRTRIEAFVEMVEAR